MWNNGVLGSPGHNDGLTPGQIAIVDAAYNPTYAQVASSLDTTPPKTFAGALANAMATYSVSASSTITPRRRPRTRSPRSPAPLRWADVVPRDV